MLKLLLKIPKGLLSVLWTVVILYLCLAPHPVSDPGIFSFEGADKVVHFIMFFILTALCLTDYWRITYPRHTKLEKSLAIAAAAVLLGGVIEVLQKFMGFGRSMDGGDLLADALGSVCALLLMSFYLFDWLRYNRRQSFI